MPVTLWEVDQKKKKQNEKIGNYWDWAGMGYIEKANLIQLFRPKIFISTKIELSSQCICNWNEFTLNSNDCMPFDVNGLKRVPFSRPI